MEETIHIAVTRQVRKEHAPEFERLLADFAGQSLHVPGSRGVHLLFPPPGSDSTEYGILRSFASAGAYPFALSFSETESTPLGHDATHRLHPLQRSDSMLTTAASPSATSALGTNAGGGSISVA